MHDDMLCCITGTIIILFTNTSLNHLQVGFAMLTVETDNIVHWLYFDYICSLSLIVPLAKKAKIESMEEYSEAKI